jgi:preprotein translocase SecE subunit
VAEVLLAVRVAQAPQGVEVTVSSSSATRTAVSWPFRAVQYIRDVRGEFQKVTFPGWEDLRKTTTVICITVIVIGVVIGLMDRLFSWVFISQFPLLFR